MLFKIIGALGLILIIVGILIKTEKRKLRNIMFIFGGIFLATYSIYIKDAIFIILQIIFILAAVYDLIKLKWRYQ